MSTLENLLPSPWPTIVAIVFVLLAVVLTVRGIRHSARSFRSPGHEKQSQWMIRGIRDHILAIGLMCFAVGLWRWSAPWLLFGLVFLAEEIVETGIMLIALRRRRP